MEAQSNMGAGYQLPKTDEQNSATTTDPMTSLPVPTIDTSNSSPMQITYQPVGSATKPSVDPLSQSQASPSPTQTLVPDVANDTDLIEKEWVDKAKQIVERTRDDPYEQSQELTLFKADYMKKRYNRIIKLGE